MASTERYALTDRSSRVFLAGASGVTGQRLILRLVQAGPVVGEMSCRLI